MVDKEVLKAENGCKMAGKKGTKIKRKGNITDG